MKSSYSLCTIADAVVNSLTSCGTSSINTASPYVGNSTGLSRRISDCDLPYHDQTYSPFPIWTYLDVKWPETKTLQYPDYPKMRHTVESDGSNLLEIAVTGFDKKELSIKIEDDSLIIKGRKEKSEGNEKEEAKEIYNSISQKNFEISFKVNDKFDTDKISTTCKNGILSINIPLSDDIKKRNRTIEIK